MNETTGSVFRKSLRIPVVAVMEKESSDLGDCDAVQGSKSFPRAPLNVDDADDHRSESRPTDTTACGIDIPAMFTDEAQPGPTSVALCHRVRRDQAERPGLTQQTERPAEEMCDQVHMAFAPYMYLGQPIRIPSDVS